MLCFSSSVIVFRNSHRLIHEWRNARERLGREPESEASAAFVDRKESQVCGIEGSNVEIFRHLQSHIWSLMDVIKIPNFKNAEMILRLPNQHRKVENVIGKLQLFLESL